LTGLSFTNVIHIGYRGQPEPPFDDYYRPFREMTGGCVIDEVAALNRRKDVD
jgi:hypothetical protein